MKRGMLLAAAVVSSLAASADAALITGGASFDMDGSLRATTPLGGTFDQATALDFGTGTGNSIVFDAMPGSVVLGGFVNPIYTAAGFTTGTAGTIRDIPNLSTSAGPLTNFYLFTNGGNTLSFDLKKITVINRTPADPSLFIAPTINVYGTGVINFTGYAPTRGSFSLGTSNTGTGMTATFQSSATSLGSAVPEPTSWAMFLGGFAMIGRGLRNRRRTASALA